MQWLGILFDRTIKRIEGSRISAADIGVGLILLATLGVSFGAYKTFNSHLTLDELLTANSDKLAVWRNIGDLIDYLLSRDGPQQEDSTSMLAARVQGKLHALLLQHETLTQIYRERLKDLQGIRWPVIAVSGDELEVLRKDIPETLIKRVQEASQASEGIILGGFSHWSMSTHLIFQSGGLADVLHEREELLLAMKSASIEVLWRLFSMLVIVLFAVMCFVWLALLRPATRKLSEARGELRMILDTIPAFVTSYSPTGHLQTSNRAYLEQWGFPKEGSHVSNVVGPQLWPKIEHKFNQALAGEEVNYDVPLVTPKGERMQNARYVPFLGEDGQISRIVVMITDVHDRYESARAQRESEEKLRITLNSIGDGVVSTDTRGMIEHMNPVACQITGWSAEEAIDKPLTEVFHLVGRDTRRRVENPVDKVLATGKVVGLANHTILISRDGREYDIRDSGAPILSVENETVGVVMVFRDATEEIALNERIVSGEKMRAVGQLAGGIAHDINNNLAIIRGYSEFMLLTHHDEQQTKEKLAQIIATCDRAAGLIDKLNAFSQQRIGPAQATDVKELLASTLDILRNTSDRRVELSMDAQADSYTVYGNPDLLQSAFMNIALNAIQAMPGGGLLSLAIDEVSIDGNSDPRLASFHLTPGRYAAIAFKDTGPGIPQENLHRIFEPYFSTKPSNSSAGAGLGLAMVYGVTREHSGAVFASNADNGGAVMTIMLPLMDEHDISIAKPAQGNATLPASALHVLMVEDEGQLREIAGGMLKEIGCQVTFAEDGQIALDIYRAMGNDIDLVLLDLNMPRLNGLELLEELKKIRPKVAAVLATGFPGEVYAQVASDPAIFSVLRKPYSFAELSTVIGQFAGSLEIH